MSQNTERARARGANQSPTSDIHTVTQNAPRVNGAVLRAALVAQASALEAQAATLRALAEGTPVSDELVDQTASPLGCRRHCAAVRRRIKQGLPGATKVGRVHSLTRAALNEELAAVSRQCVLMREVNDLEPVGVIDDLRGELDRIGCV